MRQAQFDSTDFDLLSELVKPQHFTNIPPIILHRWVVCSQCKRDIDRSKDTVIVTGGKTICHNCYL